MPTKYVHTNIISKNWKSLADFYIKIFDCKTFLPETKLSGEFLDKGTGLNGASLKGTALLLPGYEKSGPTLEIFEYETNEAKLVPPMPNREGFGHIAFSVDDVEVMVDRVVELGGKKIGEVASKEFKSGSLIFTYVTDPEGNIIELQKWEAK